MASAHVHVDKINELYSLHIHMVQSVRHPITFCALRVRNQFLNDLAE